MKKTVQLSVKVWPELKQRLIAEAARRERTPSWLCCKLLDETLPPLRPPSPPRKK